MNDERYLYVGTTIDLGEEDPSWWETQIEVGFTDEPCGNPAAWVDDEWAAADCDASPGEGWFWAYEIQSGSEHESSGPVFTPDSEDDDWCQGSETAEGVVAKAGLHTAHYEMSIDLSTSQLNCLRPGDCLRFYVRHQEAFCPAGAPECPGTGWSDAVRWPAFAHLSPTPEADVFGTICLNSCREEELVPEFVPEPGTLLLLGSGLAGLAGYATLRWRTRE